jgi:hypothetical protein
MKKIFTNLIVLLIIITLMISKLSIFLKVSKKRFTLDYVIGNENCHMACWNGFEPFVATKDSVETWLKNSGQSYSNAKTDVENDTLIWNFSIESPLVETSKNISSTAMMQFTKENTLWRIALSNIHICADTIITTYGIPKLIDTDVRNIRLGYPDEGLLFSMHVDDALFPYAITSMFITSSEWVEHFVRTNQSWKDISYIAEEGHCQDAFSVQ